MPTELEYHLNKRTDKIYLSKSLNQKLLEKDENGEIQEFVRPFRIISKVIEINETHKFIKDGKEISLRITPNGRQEIKAKFYEDTRRIFTLTIQKYTSETGSPHNTYFTFQGNEIVTLYNFIRNIALIPIKNESNTKFDDKWLEDIVLSKEQALSLIKDNPELIKEIIDSELSTDEISNLSNRKSQLNIFKKLLTDNDFFESKRVELGENKGEEAVWQNFFEKNTWIFGYGLNYIFNSPLEDEKLEQVVAGFNFNSSGKRIDALMKTKGVVSSFCFAEIKTHKQELLRKVSKPYRQECWAISDNLSGAIAQVQKSIQKFVKELPSKNEIKNKIGNLTGEQIYIYQPKSFVIIGSLDEFETEKGINEDKFSSFELFRRNQMNTEIITFDELYERAKYIIKSTEENTTT
ncbi:Shedu immune nuclease family protein [Kordia sp.]|uniref:Shedu immune nuclease family protein n=1 Tax=Kordia sp. TaxID=1965332 RepID=UPI003B5A7076